MYMYFQNSLKTACTRHLNGKKLFWSIDWKICRVCCSKFQKIWSTVSPIKCRANLHFVRKISLISRLNLCVYQTCIQLPLDFLSKLECFLRKPIFLKFGADIQHKTHFLTINSKLLFSIQISCARHYLFVIKDTPPCLVKI